MWSKTFWKDTFERAAKTVAQTAAALLVAGGTDLISAPWQDVAAVSGMAGLVSVLTSIGSGAVKSGTVSPASLVRES